MTPPKDDLYAFLGIPRTSVPAAIGEAIARAEKKLSGKHGLGLTELSRRRALLLQAKRWLAVEDRRAEYDRSLAAPKTNEEPRTSKAESPTPAAADTKTRAKPASAQATVPSSAPVPPPIAAPAAIRTGDDRGDEEETEDEETGGWRLSVPILAAALAAATLLAFGVTLGIVWLLSGREEPVVAATPEEPAAPAETPIVETPAEFSPDEAQPGVVRANASEEVVLTPTTATLIGPNVRLDAAENPPRIENWTSMDVVEWSFESPSAAIYQGTLEYAMKPECEGNRYRVAVGDAAVQLSVGSGAYADGAYRDVFFLKIPNRGLAALRIEPLDVVGGELMDFRSLTLVPRQRSFGR